MIPGYLAVLPDFWPQKNCHLSDCPGLNSGTPRPKMDTVDAEDVLELYSYRIPQAEP